MNSSPLSPLILTGRTPMAVGQSKLVFAHPADPRLLVKVVNPAGNRSRHSRVAWYHSVPRVRHLLGFSRELQEFLVAEANGDGRPNPLARIYGLIETDLGLGMVVEKICGLDGQLAPSVDELAAKARLPDELLGLLADLVSEINRRHIVVGDFSRTNVVLEEKTKGKRRFVLIDGFGGDMLIPIYSLSKYANTQRNLRKHRKLIVKADRLSATGLAN